MNIYFSGIGGVGIGPLAEIAHDAGYSVQGSDAQASLVTSELQKRGIAVEIGQDGSFLRACHDEKPIDWFVHTAALPADHPELVLAKELGIKTAKRDELIAKIIAEKNLKLLAVAGTHGKTTTSGMLVWALMQLGIPVSYSVGSTLSFGPSGVYDSNSEYFVYECDEFDRNFLHFSPFLSLITSVDYDHPDTYPTKEEYLEAFRQFVSQSDHTIVWKHDNSFGATAENAWVLDDSETLPLALPGAHNRRNGTLVAKSLEYLSVAKSEERLQSINSFPGTDRRFEKLADNLYSDYGHHPAEIAATLQLARELNDYIVLVYQPHQNIRQHELNGQYTNQFELAEKVYWLPTYLSREDPDLPILLPEMLYSTVSNKEVIETADMNNELWEQLEAARRDGKLILCMGAGSIDGWLRERLAN